MRGFFAVWVGVILIIPATILAQGLAWESQRSQVSAALDQDVIETKFSFKNQGPTPVTIVQIQTSCGCTTAMLEKKTYASGEGGALDVRFNLAGRSGRQEKTIEVTTDAAPSPTVLTLTVDIPEAFSIEPRLLIWESADVAAPEAKSVLIRPNGEFHLKVISATSDNPLFETSMSEEPAHRAYRVTLRPKNTRAPTKAIVRLLIEAPAGKHRSAAVYGMIR